MRGLNSKPLLECRTRDENLFDYILSTIIFSSILRRKILTSRNQSNKWWTHHFSWWRGGNDTIYLYNYRRPYNMTTITILKVCTIWPFSMSTFLFVINYVIEPIKCLDPLYCWHYWYRNWQRLMATTEIFSFTSNLDKLINFVVHTQ